MSQQSISLLTLSLVAAGAVTKDRFYGVTNQLCGAGANAYGVSRSDGVNGDCVPVDVIGTAIVEAGAPVAKDALVESDGTGRAIPNDTGVVLARALQAASGAGVRIEVLLIPN